MRSDVLGYLLLAFGLVLIVAGVAVIYWPAALIVAGIVVIASLLVDLDTIGRSRP